MEKKYDELLELLDNKKIIELRQKLINMNTADIAEFLETVPSNEIVVVFRMLPKELAAGAFSYMDVEEQEVINLITDREISIYWTSFLWTMWLICWKSSPPMWSSE